MRGQGVVGKSTMATLAVFMVVFCGSFVLMALTTQAAGLVGSALLHRSPALHTQNYPNCPSTDGNWTFTGTYEQNSNITCDTITVLSGGLITVNGAYAIKATNITVMWNGTIDASGLGCPQKTRPNQDNTCSANGNGIDWPLHPGLKGAGGNHGTYYAYDGAGGGPIRIDVADTLAVYGTISSIGASGAGSHENGVYDGQGGQGGSITITTDRLAGDGTVSARGGNSLAYLGTPYAPPGEGGTITVYYNQAMSDDVVLDVTPGVATGGGAGKSGTAIIIKDSSGDMWVDGGMMFLPGDYALAGTFKPGAEFNFHSLTTLNETMWMTFATNVTAQTLNFSRTTSLAINSTGHTMVFTTDGRNHPGVYLGYSTFYRPPSLTMTNTEDRAYIFDETTPVLLQTPMTLDRDVFVYTMSGSLTNLSSDGAVVVDGMYLTLNGVVHGTSVNVTATNVTVALSGGADATGGGCPQKTLPNQDNTCSVGGNGIDWPLHPGLKGAGGNHGTYYAYDGAGGGPVRIDVVDTLALYGAISSTGAPGASSHENGVYDGQGGQGGSVTITTDRLVGTGTVSARGGNSLAYLGTLYAPPGTGGAVTVYYNQTMSNNVVLDVSPGVATGGGAGQAGTSIMIKDSTDDAVISGGMLFLPGDSALAGTFKPGAEFDFHSLTIQNASMWMTFATNVTAQTLNISRMTSLALNSTGRDMVFTTDGRNYPGVYLQYDALYRPASLTISNTEDKDYIFDESTPVLLQTPMTLDRDAFVYTTLGSLTNLSSDGAVVVDGTYLTLNGVVHGTSVNVTATNVTVASAGGADATGGGCPQKTLPNQDNTCSVGGNGIDWPLHPSLKGAGGNHGTYYAYDGAGGGPVRIDVADTLALYGAISSTGAPGASSHENGVYDGQGGQGGSVTITTDRLVGTGTVSARGGNSLAYLGTLYAPPGSGGSVAIYYNQTTDNRVALDVGPGASTGGSGGAVGTAITVDVPDSIGWITGGMVFRSDDAAYAGIVKKPGSNQFNFKALHAIMRPSVQFMGKTLVINASLMNLTGTTGSVARDARLVLEYADGDSDLGGSYNPASGNFQLSVDRDDVGRVDFMRNISGIAWLNTDVNLTFDRVYVNSLHSRALNRSANITIRGLGLSNYTIIKETDDNVDTACDVPSCNRISYVNGVAFFNVSSFTAYYLTGPTAYFAPADPDTASMFVFNASLLGVLANGTVSATPQTITVMDPAGERKAEFHANFGFSNVDFSSATVESDSARTVIDSTNISGVAQTHTLYVPVDNGTGLYVCPEARTLDDVNYGCPGRVSFSNDDAVNRVVRSVNGSPVTASVDGTDYKLTGLKGTGVGSGLITQLTIWDETDVGKMYGGQARNIGDAVAFFANFTNSTGLPANTDDGACQIEFPPDGFVPMTFNATDGLYKYSRTFGTSGTFGWTVNCTGSGDTIEATDTVFISPPFVAVPEFGSFALVLALGLVFAGVMSQRSRKVRK